MSARHALCALIGLQFLVATTASAQHAASADQARTHLQNSLKLWGYFTPRDANLPDVKFYCVCGPYRSCEHEAQRIASRLGYRLPQYDFVKGMSRLRQKVLFFVDDQQVVEIEIPYTERLYFTVEFEEFCDVNLEKRVPRTKEERNAD